jgi:hypothetical protein
MMVLELVQQFDHIALQFFLNEIYYTQTVSSFRTEHIYDNYYKI